MLLALLLAAQLQSPVDSGAAAGARNPAYATDGRLAVAIRGHLWIRDRAGSWTQRTTGDAWDREPAWFAGGDSLVFSSNRGGRFALWVVGARGGEPRQLTSGPGDEGQPTVAGGGRIVFVRGRGPAAQLWVRAADGSESRLRPRSSGEAWPSASADGRRIAYVATSERESQLHVATIDSMADDRVVATGRQIERPAWSPDGARLAYTAASPRPGVYVTTPLGAYVNMVSTRRAESAWTPDGTHLLLVERPADDVAYNGDPDRLGDRDADNVLTDRGRLWMVEAPPAPDAGLSTMASAPVNQAALNARAFDELWSRTARLYYGDTSATQRLASWRALGEKFRPRALAARTTPELESVLHAMLRERPPYRNSATGRAAISSASPSATAAGLEILRRGGNVVDAAVAVSFALAVAEPDASGPGGYGQMLVFRKGMAEPTLIEFMTRVPEDATLSNVTQLPADGPGLVNVPGTVAAMYHAWERFGSHAVPWSDLLAPAIRAAREGFPVSDGLATTLATEREHFLKYPGSRALFFPHGQPLQAGDTLRNPDLAWTLEQVAAGGADAFYKGEVARRLVTDLRAHGSVIRMTDLARYYAADRAPVHGTYRGFTLYSSAPPVSGGADLVATLNNLEHVRQPAPFTDDASTLNAMIQAWQLVPSGRNRIADPGLWPVNIEPFTNKDTATARWRCYDPAHALPSAAFRGDSLACEGPGLRTSKLDITNDEFNFGETHAAGTTAFTVADADGNIVAVTQTLGTWGGNFYVSPGLGFLYNDKLASYASDSMAYGARLPYARHGSTIAPTIIFKGTGTGMQPWGAVGAAGNSWITSAVYQTTVGLIDDHLDPQAALELPRFLLGGRGTGSQGITVQVEDGYAPDVVARLREMGYTVQPVSLMGELREGYGAALRIHDGRVTAGADPRRSGTAGAVP